MNANFLFWPLLLALIGVVTAVSRKSPVDVEKLVSISDKLSTAYIQEYRNYQRYGNRSARFESLINVYKGPVDLKVKDFSTLPEPKSAALCFMCRMLVQLFIQERRNGASIEQIGQIAFDQCDILQLQPPEVCMGLVQLNAPVLLHIFDTRPNLSENEVCALLFQSSQCGEIGEYFEFSVNVNPNRRPVTGPKTASPVSPGPPLKIVHITDIHYDPHYTVGNNAVCGASVCCRHDQGPPATPAEAAGFWGDFRDCDTPPHGVEDVMDRMREAHPDIDYIYHTGDIVDHGIWITSFELVADSFNRVHNFFEDKFSTVPLYSVLGNHEAHPTNV
jgi:sphingomyelin phosphodiesterase